MIVVVAALLFGFFVIGFISRFAGNVPRVDSRADDQTPDSRPTIPPAEFEDRSGSRRQARAAWSSSSGAGNAPDLLPH
jgi:hypothetical protein